MASCSLQDGARAWVEDSCASQGLPVKVCDVSVLAQVAGLLGVPARPAAGGAPSRLAGVSGAPGGREPADVELVVAASAGGNDQVVEDGGDDRVLAA
jgi:hypothetical protein